jgi:hypothetical protein
VDLEADNYVVAAEAFGYEPASMDLAMTGTARFDLKIELTGAQRISGHVLACRRPIPGLIVLSQDGRDRPQALVDDQIEASGVCPFTTDRLVRGSYTVIAGSQEVGWGVASGVLPDTRDLMLTLAPPGRLRLNLVGPEGEPQATAFATVKAIDGFPVVVPYVLVDRDGFHRRSADARGRIDMRVPAGKVLIELLAHRYKGRLEIEVEPGATVVQDVTLREPNGLSGRP